MVPLKIPWNLLKIHTPNATQSSHPSLAAVPPLPISINTILEASA